MITYRFQVSFLFPESMIGFLVTSVCVLKCADKECCGLSGGSYELSLTDLNKRRGQEGEPFGRGLYLALCS